MTAERGPQHTPPTADIVSPQQNILETPELQGRQRVTRREAVEQVTKAISMGGIVLSEQWVSPRIESFGMHDRPSASAHPGPEHREHGGNNNPPKVKKDK